MSGQGSDIPVRRIEPFDRAALETRLREIVAGLDGEQWIDDGELRHLVRVVTGCSLLVSDVYSPARIERIMHPERGSLSYLVRRLIEEERRGEGEVLYHVRRLPDDVRLVGDKALFDLGLLGVQQVKGYDLADLGARAYRMAGEVLERLAEDRRLREFFRNNRLLALPLEDEVVFLRHAAERFDLYSELLRRIHPHGSTVAPLESLHPGSGGRVSVSATAAEARMADLGPRPVPGAGPADYLEAARGAADGGSALTSDELLSAYERMLLFASIDLDRLREGLTSVVVDQDGAVDALIDEFSLFATGTRDLRKPPAYFLVGPTGVGKNHLVESLVRMLEGIWNLTVPLLTIEGPSYTYPSDINELKGATRGFIRSDEDGILTTFHEKSSRTPFSVLLVDEVEKAHPQLRTFFLSILDRGTTTDNRGRVLNFANSMVFFTSNLGYSNAMQGTAPIGYGDAGERAIAASHDVAQDLRRALRPEFLNRVRLIHFRPLGRESAARLLDLEFDRIARRYRDVHGIELRLAESAREAFLERGFSPRFGARHMAAMLEQICNVEISRRIRRDDRRLESDREQVVAWLRRVRSSGEPVDLDEVRKRVVATTRVSLDYDALEIVFEDGAFEYLPVPLRTDDP